MTGGSRVSRRGLLAGAVGAAGLGAGGLAVGRVTAAHGSSAEADAASTVPFHGRHQAGITTPAQDRLAFAAFDVTTDDRAELSRTLRTWTAAAERMTKGRAVGPVAGAAAAPPVDTGEALDLPASALTLTVGFGPALFDGRFGLAAHRPPGFADLPPLPGDELEPARSGGDLCVQACANDPQVAFHAVRNLARLGRGTVVIRWFQLGFGRTSTTSRGQATPRNLMGFKDGTNNLRAEDTGALTEHVWVSSGPGWLDGGTFLVARRIRMLIEAWDRASITDQERSIGRLNVSGAPLGGESEFDTVRLARLPAHAHSRLAAPANNGGTRILRRGYSYTDGVDVRTGQLDAGLFFLSFQNDVDRGFVAIQRKLGAQDALAEYLKHTGSAVFACPPGVSTPGDWWGSALWSSGWSVSTAGS